MVFLSTSAQNDKDLFNHSVAREDEIFIIISVVLTFFSFDKWLKIRVSVNWDQNWLKWSQEVITAHSTPIFYKSFPFLLTTFNATTVQVT